MRTNVRDNYVYKIDEGVRTRMFDEVRRWKRENERKKRKKEPSSSNMYVNTYTAKNSIHKSILLFFFSLSLCSLPSKQTRKKKRKIIITTILLNSLQTYNKKKWTEIRNTSFFLLSNTSIWHSSDIVHSKKNYNKKKNFEINTKKKMSKTREKNYKLQKIHWRFIPDLLF